MLTKFLNRLTQFSDHMKQAEEDEQTDRAAFYASRILAIHQVPKGVPHQAGPFTITRAYTTGGERVPGDTDIEIDYHGRRVMNYSAYGDGHCTVVSRRQMSPDLGWMTELAAEFQKALRVEHAQTNQSRYLVG